MGALELAAVVATVLAAAGVSPQCVRLARTGDPEGVSLPGAALGVVTEAAWVAFMVEHHIWSAVTMPVLMVLANASLVYWIVRAGCDVRTAFVAASGWVLVLGAVVSAGGWTTLGFVLGFSYAIQITPTIYSAYRSHVPTGIAPARWLMVMGETSLWMFYGFALSRTEHRHLRDRRLVGGRHDPAALDVDASPCGNAGASVSRCRSGSRGLAGIVASRPFRVELVGKPLAERLVVLARKTVLHVQIARGSPRAERARRSVGVFVVRCRCVLSSSFPAMYGASQSPVTITSLSFRSRRTYMPR